MSTLFGTSGIRGDAVELFTDQFCFDIGRVFSIFLKRHNENGSIAMGSDPRDSSPRIKASVIAGLVYEGREVFDEGTTSIPSMNYILKVESNLSGSIMVTGSHIKAELNGLKFFAFGEEILKEHEKEIDEIYVEEKGKIKYREVEDKDIVHIEDRARLSYIDYLVSFANMPYPDWKVVVDPGNGAQSETMPEVFKILGIDTVPTNVSIQKNFLSRDTEVEKDFVSLQQEVVKNKADFGIGYDSDGDRVIFVDEKGEFVPGDYTGTLIAKHLDESRVVTTTNTSQVVDKIGLQVVRCKVGSPYVVEKLKELNISFGFESNGGGIFKEMRSRDGGRSTIEILNLLKKSGKSLSKLVGELPKYYIFRDKIEYKWELKEKIMDDVRSKFKGIKTEEVDGLKIWLNEDTWILFRSSMNAPEFRVFVESKSKEKAENLLREGIDFVKDIVGHA